MSTDPSGFSDSPSTPSLPPLPPTAPPTSPVFFQPAPARSAWPGVIGTIAIVVGALGALMYLWGALSPLFMEAFTSFVEKANPQARAQMEINKLYLPFTETLSIAMLAISIVLLVGGSGLVQRRPWGVRLVLIWAVARIAGAGAQVVLQARLMDKMQQVGAFAGTGMPAGFMGLFTNVAIGGGLLFCCAMPVFALIWFARRRIRAEVASWKTAAGAH